MIGTSHQTNNINMQLRFLLIFYYYKIMNKIFLFYIFICDIKFYIFVFL